MFQNDSADCESFCKNVNPSEWILPVDSITNARKSRPFSSATVTYFSFLSLEALLAARRGISACCLLSCLEVVGCGIGAVTVVSITKGRWERTLFSTVMSGRFLSNGYFAVKQCFSSIFVRRPASRHMPSRQYLILSWVVVMNPCLAQCVLRCRVYVFATTKKTVSRSFFERPWHGLFWNFLFFGRAIYSHKQKDRVTVSSNERSMLTYYKIILKPSQNDIII